MLTLKKETTMTEKRSTWITLSMPTRASNEAPPTRAHWWEYQVGRKRNGTLFVFRSVETALYFLNEAGPV